MNDRNAPPTGTPPASPISTMVLAISIVGVCRQHVKLQPDLTPAEVITGQAVALASFSLSHRKTDHTFDQTKEAVLKAVAIAYDQMVKNPMIRAYMAKDQAGG